MNQPKSEGRASIKRRRRGFEKNWNQYDEPCMGFFPNHPKKSQYVKHVKNNQQSLQQRIKEEIES